MADVKFEDLTSGEVHALRSCVLFKIYISDEVAPDWFEHALSMLRVKGVIGVRRNGSIYVEPRYDELAQQCETLIALVNCDA